MTTAEDKLYIIEEILATNDAYLLEAIKALLHHPVSDHNSPAPMSIEVFEEKFSRAERAIATGETTSLDEVRVIAAGWAKK